jgi:aminomethyltransferase
MACVMDFVCPFGVPRGCFFRFCLRHQLLKTPLHDLHVELGARMVPFAGYSMPVQYPAGLMAEHKHTRDAPACSTSRTWASCAWSGPMPPPPSRP